MENCDGVYIYLTYEEWMKYIEWRSAEYQHDKIRTDDTYPVYEIRTTNDVNIDW